MRCKSKRESSVKLCKKKTVDYDILTKHMFFFDFVYCNNCHKIKCLIVASYVFCRACLNGRREVVNVLLNVRGHMLIQPNTHDTVLHAAISSQEPRIVEMILKVCLGAVLFFFQVLSILILRIEFIKVKYQNSNECTVCTTFFWRFFNGGSYSDCINLKREVTFRI